MALKFWFHIACSFTLKQMSVSYGFWISSNLFFKYKCNYWSVVLDNLYICWNRGGFINCFVLEFVPFRKLRFWNYLTVDKVTSTPKNSHMCLGSMGVDDLNRYSSQVLIEGSGTKRGFLPSKEDFVRLFHILFVKGRRR